MKKTFLVVLGGLVGRPKPEGVLHHHTPEAGRHRSPDGHHDLAVLLRLESRRVP